MNTLRAIDAAPDSACIRVRNVTHRYRRATRDALHDITIDIPRGSIFGLLGPNGAGKSSLLGLLSGSLALQSGAISIAGAALPGDARRIKGTSAVVPQEYAFYEDLSGRENLDYFAGTYGLARAQTNVRIERCARICRLTDVLAQRAGDYSGGLKRRLNMAIGLLNEPQILYLDEPTVGIDAESRRYIVEAIRELRGTGVTIVYTSHYMEEVEQLCDAIAVIDRGRLMLQGSMESLLQHEGEKALFLRLENPAENLAEPLARYRAEHVGYRDWNLDVTLDQLPEVLRVIAQHGARIERLQHGVSRLEKIYLQLLADGAASESVQS